MLTLAVALSLAAHADRPLLHDGDAADAVARAVAASGEPAWAFDPLTLAELVADPSPTVLGPVQPCARQGPATNAALRAAADRAQLRIQRQDLAAARADLTEARALLACLSEEADAERAALVFLMSGVVAWSEGDEAAATAAFDRAHRFRLGADGTPQLAWDPRLAAPDRGGDAFAAAAAALSDAPRGLLRVAPGVDPARLSLRIDGRTVPPPGDVGLALPAGYHHVQLLTGGAVRTLEVEVGADAALLVVDPAGLRGLAVADHVGTAPLAELVRATRPGAGAAYAVAGDTVWRLEADWATLPSVDPTAAERASRRAGTLRAAGYTAAGVGALMAGAGLAGFAAVRTPPAWESTVEMSAWRQSQATAWRAVGLVGVGLVVGGGATAGVGHARSR